MEQQRGQGLVAYLALQHGMKGGLGKKAAQKLMHILTSIGKIDTGFEFSFYTYGAFSRELASTIDILSNSDVIDVKYNAYDNSYSIKSTDNSAALIENLRHDIRSEADRVWNKFSGKTASELELLSTILFVHDEENIPITHPDMTTRVKLLKPKYSNSHISLAQGQLDEIVQVLAADQ
ncbi:hypothetical protein EMQ25_03250 [Arsenicitalea aurantiaca]|uniref:Uncharacterized protein n=1 Tax=Arsenicitalea aurantiaca TaxID=1783274 RepID=A0A433XLN2_9HYPH|nr:hypothetical protein [Arsenicitalea aurantiaca]RUT34985.1 hypothetical protein EMQ25_03250 [Arsenicitalea aurantiaca]